MSYLSRGTEGTARTGRPSILGTDQGVTLYSTLRDLLIGNLQTLQEEAGSNDRKWAEGLRLMRAWDPSVKDPVLRELRRAAREDHLEALYRFAGKALAFAYAEESKHRLLPGHEYKLHLIDFDTFVGDFFQRAAQHPDTRSQAIFAPQIRETILSNLFLQSLSFAIKLKQKRIGGGGGGRAKRSSPPSEAPPPPAPRSEEEDEDEEVYPEDSASSLRRRLRPPREFAAPKAAPIREEGEEDDRRTTLTMRTSRTARTARTARTRRTEKGGDDEAGGAPPPDGAPAPKRREEEDDDRRTTMTRATRVTQSRFTASLRRPKEEKEEGEAPPPPKEGGGRVEVEEDEDGGMELSLHPGRKE